jgi:hypothetical protein
MIRQAMAISNIAPASYINVLGSMSLPCSIINLDNAVIAINNGKVIGILLLT